jgi:hypothetical protein
MLPAFMRRAGALNDGSLEEFPALRFPIQLAASVAAIAFAVPVSAQASAAVKPAAVKPAPMAPRMIS